MFRGSVLLLAVLISAPALWSTFVAQSMSVYVGLLRFLIAVPIAAVMLMLMRSVTASYHRAARQRQLERLSSQQSGDTQPN
jgi:membrane protein implicated in regulation of membrane protease activity